MRFTIRDVLWLTVVAGMALGWCFSAGSLWMGKAFCEQEIRLCNEELARLRAEVKQVAMERDDANAERDKAIQAWKDAHLELASFQQTGGPRSRQPARNQP